MRNRTEKWQSGSGGKVCVETHSSQGRLSWVQRADHQVCGHMDVWDSTVELRCQSPTR